MCTINWERGNFGALKLRRLSGREDGGKGTSELYRLLCRDFQKKRGGEGGEALEMPGGEKRGPKIF